MTAPESEPLAVISVRIPKETKRKLKVALAANGTTLQASMSSYAERYVERFYPKATS